MPKKFATENTKAAVARARKEAAKNAELDRKQKAEEDAFWADDDKNALRKQNRKEEKEKKKSEQAEKKAINRLLHDEEMESLKGAKPQKPEKVTRTQIMALQEAAAAKCKSDPKAAAPMIDETPLEENVNRLIFEGESARNIDEAIAVLSVSDTPVDRHPEKRMKAAYQAFEDQRLPQLKAENPNLRLSQLKQLLKKEWMKSPDNPLNQVR